VKLKRQLDRIAYISAPLFPPDFLKHYNEFIELCFRTYADWGKDARLRTKSNRRADAAGEKWIEDWSACFASDSECSDPKALREAYGKLVAYLAKELGVGIRTEPIETGRLPTNIR
jgi:hypothetical protein